LSAKKLPIGIQFVGPVLGDAQVLRAAQLFQAYTDFHKQRPPLS
jgi:Asp-tRNA(Asn)/Glu-tRNA(Gln) amidotransferase A subunit family amidase